MKKTKEAFRWIVKILRKKKIPFHISGGFAAKIYGSQRPLNDIDIDIPDKKIKEILPEVQKYIIDEGSYKTKVFDSPHDLTLKYKGQVIDITGANTERIYNIKKKKWTHEFRDFGKCEEKKVFGLTVPVLPREDLLKYKLELLEGGEFREHQVRDVEALLSLKEQYPKSFIPNK